MSEDQDDPDIKAGWITHQITACIFELFRMVGSGQGRWIDEAKLIEADSNIQELRRYLREHRQNTNRAA